MTRQTQPKRKPAIRRPSKFWTPDRLRYWRDFDEALPYGYTGAIIGVSPERYARDSGCESKEIYEVAERIATYVNDLARLQEEGWKRAQAMLANERRNSPGYQKLKAWWSEDKNWFCILSDDGINQTTISLTVEEASLLSMSAEPPVEKIPSAEARAERIARDAGGLAVSSQEGKTP